MNPRQTRALLVGLMVSGGPALLGLDLVARGFILDGQPEDVRQMLTEIVTRFAWMVVPAPVLGGVAGFLLYPRVFAWQLGRSTPGNPETAAHNADLTALMISASLPQLPALLGDFSVMLGARLTPAICSTTLSTLAVLAIALFARRPAGEATR